LAPIGTLSVRPVVLDLYKLCRGYFALVNELKLRLDLWRRRQLLH